jgi:hypothetical protein
MTRKEQRPGTSWGPILAGAAFIGVLDLVITWFVVR